jgi:hypothetical protein
MKKIGTVELGRAGELRVASELILRGFNPSLVLLDNGADIILENGTKIQVKTCGSLSKNNRCNKERYKFLLRRGDGKIKYTNECDYFILWCIDDNYFKVLPTEEAIKKSVWSINRGDFPETDWEILRKEGQNGGQGNQRSQG